jgi:ribosome maturation factor RimP
MSRADLVRPVLHQALDASGLVVEDVSVTAAGRRSVVRVLLDRDLRADGADDAHEVTTPTEPLSLDEVADATRLVSDALDASDVLGDQPYTLEVSSPGVGRPLTAPRHFRRNVGRLLTARVGDHELRGRVVSAGTAAVTLELVAEGQQDGRTERLAYTDISRASVQIEFARPDTHEEH